MSYNGWLHLDEEEASRFYQNHSTNMPVFENEYVIINEKEVYCYQNGDYRRVKFPFIKNAYSGYIKPRNAEQVAAMDMLQDKTSTIKLVTGTWGTGKTMLLASNAIDALLKNEYEKIVWVRNNVQVKDTDNLGALPGSEIDKVLPYAMPLADHCGGVEGLKALIEQGSLEIIPLGFLRGRSIRDSIIMCSEAENLTKEHIQLIMGRVDEGSTLWLDADTRQRDRAAFDKSRGVETMIERLMGDPLFGYVHLLKTERSATAALADKLND